MKYATTFFLLVWWTTYTYAESDNRETIYWYIPNIPPISFYSGPYRGKGWADRRIEALRKQLPMFRHEIVEGSGVRMREEFKSKPNVCSANLLKTPERTAVTEFSAVFSWIMSNGVFTMRSRLPQFHRYLNERGELRLGHLLAEGKYRVGTLGVRSYGAGIDALLKQYAGQASVVMMPENSDHAGTILKLANNNGFDLTPGYAIELPYLVRELGLDEREFVFLPVAGQPQLLPTYVGCSKSVLGKRIISYVNAAIADGSTQREDYAAYRAWLDKDMAVRYDRLLRQQSHLK